MLPWKRRALEQYGPPICYRYVVKYQTPDGCTKYGTIWEHQEGRFMREFPNGELVSWKLHPSEKFFIQLDPCESQQ